MKKINHSHIKTIWFDLGNVILFFDLNIAFKKLLRYTDLSLNSIRAYFRRNNRIEADVDEGRISAVDLYNRFKKDLNLNGLSYTRFKILWNNIFCLNHETADLIRRLRSNGYRLVLISNTNRLHFDYIIRKYSIVKRFDSRVLSYRLRARKPKQKIYKKALSLSKAKPSEIFYIDDRADLIKAAKSNHGVYAHRFKTASSLKRALKSSGVNIV